jgi:putative IMPACT (imprinted ancient) family translation regulator
VQQALESLPVREQVRRARLQIEIDYAAVTPFQRLLPEYEGEVVAENYGAVASYLVDVPVEHLEGLRAALLDRTGGLARIEELREPEE